MKGSLAGRHHLVKGARELRADEVPAAVLERFKARLRERESGCLEWTGALNGDGYGIVVISSGRKNRRLALAHRLAWALEYGSCPASLILDHFACSNRRCSRVAHLRLTAPEANTPAIYGNAPPAPKLSRPIIDTEGRRYENVDEWWSEVQRRAELRYGAKCAHGFRVHTCKTAMAAS
jgi:hypothetical protein